MQLGITNARRPAVAAALDRRWQWSPCGSGDATKGRITNLQTLGGPRARRLSQLGEFLPLTFGYENYEARRTAG
ncbi:MAG: hypothetical protein M3R15_25945 [Acidobacteriota bacterium]|nr:hypothetical protein [Acidobacteriota bacterium]